jgi:Virulence protein
MALFTARSFLAAAVWLSQAQLCELFDKNKRTISEHIQNIFKEGELFEKSVIRKFRRIQNEIYRLDQLATQKIAEMFGEFPGM